MNNKKKVLFLKKPGKPLEVDVCAIPDWDGFDKLIKFLENEYDAEVIERVDGPGARKWILKTEGHKFELRHDDHYGNYLFSPSVSCEKIVEKIGLDLEKRLEKL